MKLKNLLFATCAAVALVACSNDDDPIQGGGNETPQLVDAQLSVGVTTEVVTKAEVSVPGEDEGAANEAYVNTLTLYLFDKDGNYYKHETKTATTATLSEFDNMTVKVAAPTNEEDASTTTFTGVLVANNPEPATAYTNLAALKIAMAKEITTCASYSEDSKTYLPMVSQEIIFGGIKPGPATNWWEANGKSTLSKPGNGLSEVALTRLVAKVGTVTLKTNFSGTYANSTFTVTNIYIANVVGLVQLYGDQGGTDYIYTGKDILSSDIQDHMLYQPATKKDVYTISGNSLQLTSNTQDVDINRYIYPNKGFKVGDYTYYTELLIEGKFKQNSSADAVTKYYHIPLKSETGNTPEVKRNYVYNVIATITGEGSDGPDGQDKNAAIAVKITVDPWFVVTQTEDDIN